MVISLETVLFISDYVLQRTYNYILDYFVNIFDYFVNILQSILDYFVNILQSIVLLVSCFSCD